MIFLGNLKCNYYLKYTIYSHTFSNLIHNFNKAIKYNIVKISTCIRNNNNFKVLKTCNLKNKLRINLKTKLMGQTR